MNDLFFCIQITPEPSRVLISQFLGSEVGMAWLGILVKLLSQCHQGCCHLKAGLGLEGLLPRWLTPTAVGRRPPFLAMWSSPLGCFSVLRTWQLTRPMIGDPKEKAGDTTVLSPSWTWKPFIVSFRALDSL